MSNGFAPLRHMARATRHHQSHRPCHNGIRAEAPRKLSTVPGIPSPQNPVTQYAFLDPLRLRLRLRLSGSRIGNRYYVTGFFAGFWGRKKVSDTFSISPG